MLAIKKNAGLKILPVIINEESKDKTDIFKITPILFIKENFSTFGFSFSSSILCSAFAFFEIFILYTLPFIETTFSFIKSIFELNILSITS